MDESSKAVKRTDLVSTFVGSGSQRSPWDADISRIAVFEESRRSRPSAGCKHVVFPSVFFWLGETKHIRREVFYIFFPFGFESYTITGTGGEADCSRRGVEGFEGNIATARLRAAKAAHADHKHTVATVWHVSLHPVYIAHAWSTIALKMSTPTKTRSVFMMQLATIFSFFFVCI